MSHPYTLDDLPRFSPWPARLLGLEPWEPKCKTAQEVTREYEVEKWGPLLAKVRQAQQPISLAQVDEWHLGNLPPALCSINGQLDMLPPQEAHQQYLNIIEGVLKQYLPTSALIELGAGYGSIILGLAETESFRQTRLLAGEYTASGMELIHTLAKAQSLAIETAYCDFAWPTVTELSIPAGAILFTSFATHYVPKLSPDFINQLTQFQPRIVAHFEPCYEHCDSTTLLGLMRRRYIEVNDYNRNLATLLYEQQQQGRIKILEERPAVFGTNSLLAASIIVWQPNLL